MLQTSTKWQLTAVGRSRAQGSHVTASDKSRCRDLHVTAPCNTMAISSDLSWQQGSGIFFRGGEAPTATVVAAAMVVPRTVSRLRAETMSICISMTLMQSSSSNRCISSSSDFGLLEAGVKTECQDKSLPEVLPSSPCSTIKRPITSINMSSLPAR